MYNNSVSYIGGASPESVAGQNHNDEASLRHGGGSGGGDDMQIKVAKLEAHIEYIRRDIEELKTDVKSIDGRLTTIETGISSLKTTFKATGVIVSLVFAFCVYVFGSYVSKILDVLNGLVLK
ncbi:hemolysin XhlA [Yersinia enterocolitica]|uniref:hemolysin XhlA n=1 Tax=Yersinia enterocolitica TaxID=630 RepID=UPI00398D62FE